MGKIWGSPKNPKKTLKNPQKRGQKKATKMPFFKNLKKTFDFWGKMGKKEPTKMGFSDFFKKIFPKTAILGCFWAKMCPVFSKCVLLMSDQHLYNKCFTKFSLKVDLSNVFTPHTTPFILCILLFFYYRKIYNK